MSRYERPRIQTLDSTQIVELMGPAQGYAGTGGNGREGVDSISSGSFDGWHPSVR